MSIEANAARELLVTASRDPRLRRRLLSYLIIQICVFLAPVLYGTQAVSRSSGTQPTTTPGGGPGTGGAGTGGGFVIYGRAPRP